MNNQFIEKKFTIPELRGISKRTIEEHLKLYAGYVKNANLIMEKIAEYAQASEQHAYALGELQRRFSFEHGGMRNHEIYFALLQDGPKDIAQDGALYKAIAAEWGSFDAWLLRFKAIALTRGIGWVILAYDPVAKRLINSWTDEQHIGQLLGTHPIIALDMWEHSYVADYMPSGKKNYVEDFFANMNWEAAEAFFKVSA